MTYSSFAPAPEISDGAWTLTAQQQSPSPGGVGTLVRFIRIVATDETVAEWNAQFWALFPREPAEFAALAKGSGIGVHVDRMVMPLTRRVSAWYGGYTPDQLKRAAHRGQHAKEEVPAELRRLLDEYERDVECESREMASAFTDLVKKRLPTPSEGYRWGREHGGLIGSGFHFRLWHRDFGYMPGVE